MASQHCKTFENRGRNVLSRGGLLLAMLLMLTPRFSVAGQVPVLPKDVQMSDGADIGVTIMGTIVQRKAENNVALIKEVKSGKVLALKPGYKFLDKYEVVEISGKFMVIKAGGQKTLIYQDKFAGEFARASGGSSTPVTPLGSYNGEAPEFFKEEGFERQANSVTMSGSYRDKVVTQDMATVLMQATAEPYIEGGQVVGFKLSQIDAGSIYWKGGLKDDDVITEINGQKLDSVAKAVLILKTLKQESQIDVGVLRKGAPVKFSLKIN